MSLSGLPDDLAAEDPEAVLAIDASPRGAKLTSRRELRRRAGALRAGLDRAGVRAGDCVAVWLPNWSDTLAWQFAAAALGAHVVGVNTRYNVDEAVHVLERARPKIVAIAHEFHELDLLGRLRKAVVIADAPVPVVVPVPGPQHDGQAEARPYDLGGGAWTMADLTGSGDAGPGDASPGDASPGDARPGDTDPGTINRDGADLAVAFTTSGSTGKPKLAAHRETAVEGHARDDARAIGLGPGDVALCALPLSGTFGFSTAMAAIAGGGACLLEPAFDPVAALDDMAAHGVTHVIGGDDMISRLADAWAGHQVGLPALRWFGAADFIGRMPDVVAWARRFGAVTSGVYGSSEVFALILLWPGDEPEPRRWLGGGRVVGPETEIRTADPVTGAVLPAGEQGELQFRGPTVADAYLGDADAMARNVTGDGWFRSGDLAVIGADGAAEFACRMGDVLRLRGFLVAPAEIEARLAAHETVDVAKVVGVREATGATRAVAFVVAAAGARADPETLREWCAAGLAAFKVPAEVRVIAEMPTTSGTNGSKIRAATLREWAAATAR
ncbi:MAG: AMP-binding protein [Trebonia sp.]